MVDAAEARLKRIRMRSWRRGTKEMDLILGPFSDVRLTELSDRELDIYEALLAENDQDLYKWLSGKAPTPGEHAEIMGKIRAHHHI